MSCPQTSRPPALRWSIVSTLRVWLILAALVAAPALAGCASNAPDEPLKTGSSNSNSPAPTTSGSSATPTAGTQTKAERWHFHDYWNGEPVITLFDDTVTLEPTARADLTGGLSVVFALPKGTIVPPETGQLDLSVAWAGTAGGRLNLTYRPADTSAFQPGGDLANGGTSIILTSESMTDVPHRARSLWAFNLTAAAPAADAASAEPGVAGRDVRVVITATIGRPLFIDPPHLDWWQGTDAFALVAAYQGEVTTAITPAGNLSLDAPRQQADAQTISVHADAGRIVPEGTQTIIARLAWTSQAPSTTLALAYAEDNEGTSGPAEVLEDAAGERWFSIAVAPGQTDTTYSNRTTWRFYVTPDSTAPAFSGSFSLDVWVSRLAAPDAFALAQQS